MEAHQEQLEEVEPQAFATPHRELSGLADGERVDCCYVVRDRSRRPTKRGGEWLALKLSDRSGSVSAKSWDEIEAALRGRRSRDDRPDPRPLRVQPAVGQTR